jgi:3-oxoacyl-[acyl-carrier-protein] synthase-1
MREVVVSGLGFVTCIGNDKESVSENLRSMRHGISPCPALDPASSRVHVAGLIKGYDVESPDQEDWTFPPDMPPLRLEQLRALAPHGAYAIRAVTKAIEDAWLPPELVRNPATGMYTASSGSSRLLHANLDKMKRLGARRCPPLGVVSSIAGTLNFSLISYFGIQGASTGFVSACASSGHALGHAIDQIALGRQDRMIVVGAEDCNADTILPFASMRALSTCADPDKASRPFDRNRDGFVGTGGAVAMVIESAASAASRSARIHARILGWGQGSDGYHPMMPHPEGDGLARAMREALASARLAPTTSTTSTPTPPPRKQATYPNYAP